MARKKTRRDDFVNKLHVKGPYISLLDVMILTIGGIKCYCVFYYLVWTETGIYLDTATWKEIISVSSQKVQLTEGEMFYSLGGSLIS